MNSKLHSVFLLVILSLLGLQTKAQTILSSYDFNPITATPAFGPSPYAGTAFSNVTAGGLTRGSGVLTTGTPAARGWGGVSWQATSGANAVSANQFFTFTVKANAGYQISIDSLRFPYRRSASGAASGMLDYSLNGTTFTTATTLSFTNTSSAGAIIRVDLSSIAALKNVPSSTTITFRIAGFGGTASAGTLYCYDVVNSTAPDLCVIGSVTPSNGPLVVTAGTLNEFASQGIGVPSNEQSFTVSGMNLTNDLIVTAPTGYEVSMTSGAGFAPSITIIPNLGVVNNTTIYVRYTPTALTDQSTVVLTASSIGSPTQSINCLGSIYNLNSNDIAIIGMNASSRNVISFVAVNSIPANTKIKFTDNGYSDPNTQMLTEGTLIYTAPINLTPGTVVTWTNGMNVTGSGWSASAPSGFTIAVTGDQLFAYQGTWGVSSGFTSLLNGMMTGGTWATTGTITNVTSNSYLPAALSLGVNALYSMNPNAYYANNTANTTISQLNLPARTKDTINWTTSPTQISPVPSWLFNIIAEEPTGQAFFQNTTNITTNGMTLNFNGGNGDNYLVVVKNGSPVSGVPVDATTYIADTNFSVGSSIAIGEHVVYNGPSSIKSVSIAGLTYGTNYYYAIFPYNGVGNKANYLTISPGNGVDMTNGIPNSTSSDIITDTSFYEPENIAYQNYQDTADVTLANSIEVARFQIRDGGFGADIDTASTVLTSIGIAVQGNQVLSRLALYNGSNEIADLSVTDTLVNYTGLSFYTHDNTTENLSIRATFKAKVTDNAQFGFTIRSVANSATGSSFYTYDAGAAQTSLLGDKNRIEVTANQLRFIQQPTRSVTNYPVNPSITVAAIDVLQNTDLDYVTDMVLNSNALVSNNSTTTVTPILGIGTFSNIMYASIQSGVTVEVTSGSLISTGSSSNFDIIKALEIGDISIIGYSGTNPDKFSFALHADVPAGTSLTFTDNAFNGTSLTTNEGVVVWTSPNRVLNAGTVVTVSIPLTNTVVVDSTNGLPNGSATMTSNFALATGGDQLLCYRGASFAPIFITAFSSTPWVNVGATINTNNSVLPTGLIAGITASNTISSFTNGYYNNTTTGSNYLLRSLINNRENWLTSASLQSLYPKYTINFSSRTQITANASITDLAILDTDTFALGNFRLTLNGVASGNGVLRGSSLAGITITGAGNHGVLKFDQSVNGSTNTIKDFVLTNGGISIGNSINNTGTLTLTAGNLVIDSGATYNFSGTSISRVSGIIDFKVLNAELKFNNSNVLSLPAGLFAGAVPIFTIEGAQITLNSPLFISNKLNLKGGNLIGSQLNYVSVSNNQYDAITRTNGFINAPLTRTISMMLTNGPSYVFPIGKNTYNAFELVEPNTNGFGDFDLRVNLIDSNTGAVNGTGMNALHPNLIWDAQILTTNSSFISAKVKLSDSSIYSGSSNAIAYSQLVNGSFDYLDATLTDSSNLLSSNQLLSLGYFTVGAKTPTMPQMASLELKTFIQGLYTGNGSMTPSLYNADPNNLSSIADSIEVELHEAFGSYLTIFTQKQALSTNGICNLSFPSAVVGNNYYVVVKHRNSIPVWSAVPLSFTFTNSVDLTTSASSVFGSNVVELESGIFGMYSGDINQDGFIDGNDFIDVDNDNAIFASGYLVTDVNGDAFVDGNDFIVIDNNNALFIGVTNP